jgi:hypothetical protein
VIVAGLVLIGKPLNGQTQTTNISQTISHTVSYDSYSLIVDGHRVFLYSGEIHPFRLPSPSLWLDLLQKIKAAGFTGISCYFDWGYHSLAPGVYDFTGIRDLDRFLDLASQVGLCVTARPGPYINAETDGGGFPAWLKEVGGNVRSTDPKGLQWALQWLSQIDAIVARHQLTNGTGSVIASEFGGGTTDEWAGPGYQNCFELTNQNYESVFYKSLIGQGLTMMNFYMTYGGTSWGWLPYSGRADSFITAVYTSYDYGAAISEARC